MYYLTWLTKDWKLREAICDSFRLVWESFGRQQNCFQKRTRSQAIWRNLLDWQLWIPSRYKIKWMNVKIEILISYFQYFSTHVEYLIEILQVRCMKHIVDVQFPTFVFHFSKFKKSNAQNSKIKSQNDSKSVRKWNWTESTVFALVFAESWDHICLHFSKYWRTWLGLVSQKWR